MFIIHLSGKKYRFDNLADAKRAAEDVFQRRGIVVTIVAES